AIPEVEEVVPGVGVRVHDLLRDERFLLIDLGFSQTVVEGGVLATRLLPFERFVTTSGAALPASPECIGAVIEYLEGMEIETDAEGYLCPTRHQEAETGLEITRIFLEEHTSSYIGYQDIGEATSLVSDRKDSGAARPPRPEPIADGREKVGRNDPCPCGSGKKYKKCCGRRGTR
ncbi:MAG: SEC-C metal-binding domain-containing protein, partial [Planctomycetota bacterium]